MTAIDLLQMQDSVMDHREKKQIRSEMRREEKESRICVMLLFLQSDDYV